MDFTGPNAHEIKQQSFQQSVREKLAGLPAEDRALVEHAARLHEAFQRASAVVKYKPWPSDRHFYGAADVLADAMLDAGEREKVFEQLQSVAKMTVPDFKINDGAERRAVAQTFLDDNIEAHEAVKAAVNEFQDTRGADSTPAIATSANGAAAHDGDLFDPAHLEKRAEFYGTWNKSKGASAVLAEGAQPPSARGDANSNSDRTP